jgi:hypothetical protein
VRYVTAFDRAVRAGTDGRGPKAKHAYLVAGGGNDAPRAPHHSRVYTRRLAANPNVAGGARAGKLFKLDKKAGASQ